MAKYIQLIKYTRNGVENVKENPTRLDAVKKLCESMGAKVEGFYLTVGRHDTLVLVDAPDSKAMAKISLGTASKGSVSTETLPAFTEEKYRKIIDAMA